MRKYTFLFYNSTVFKAGRNLETKHIYIHMCVLGLIVITTIITINNIYRRDEGNLNNFSKVYNWC